MDYLSRCLNTIFERLRASAAFHEIPITDLMPYQPLLNHQLVHVALISVNRMPYCRYHNDAAAEFYGLADRNVTSQNVSFYYQRMRTWQHILILHGYHFFVQNKPGEFRCTVDMKDKDGVFHPLHTVFRTMAWDENGKAAYAAVVACPVLDLRYYEAYELLGLSRLPPRSLDAARVLFRGYSNPEIAAKLNVSVKTVEKELREVFCITQTTSRKQLFEKFEKFREQFTGPPEEAP